jgi:hypothetical protein
LAALPWLEATAACLECEREYLENCFAIIGLFWRARSHVAVGPLKKKQAMDSQRGGAKIVDHLVQMWRFSPVNTL